MLTVIFSDRIDSIISGRFYLEILLMLGASAILPVHTHSAHIFTHD